MKLHQQLILFILVSTAIPMVIGLVILRHSESQIVERLLSERKKTAQSMSDMANSELHEILERVSNTLDVVEVSAMSDEELEGFLGIVYKQSDQIVQVSLLDRDGDEIVKGIFLQDPKKYPEYLSRLPASSDSHERFLKTIPLKQTLKTPTGNAVVSDVYKTIDGRKLLITFTMPLEVSGEQVHWVVAIQLRLDYLSHRLIGNAKTQNLDIIVVDADGRTILSSYKHDNGFLSIRSSDSAVAKFMAGQDSGAFFDNEKLNAFSKIDLLNWAVVIKQSRTAALSQIRKARMVTLTATALSILALVALGLIFTRKITGKLKRFVDSAKKISNGNLDVSVRIDSSDELGLLADSFNKMVDDLKKSKEEIEEWNRELSRRVEERTEELRIANKRLLEASKLAAIGQLGAGVAHEVNNPLVGILGNTQLMLSKLKLDEKSKETLEKIESSAKRCRDVIQNLLRFSEQEADPEHLPCDINKIIQDAFSLTEQSMLTHGIKVQWDLAGKLPKVLGASSQLMNVFLNIFSNARTAMIKTGSESRLTISSKLSAENELVVTIQDTGKGIEPENTDRIFDPFFTTKDVWTNTGMGLSVAYRVIADHGGKIQIQSKPDVGTTVGIRFPVI